MKKASIALIILLCYASSGFALEIKGRVLSSSGKPISEAVILHRLSGAKSSTNQEGFFFISIPDEERIILFIIHPEYMEEEVSLSTKDLTQTLTFILDPYIRQREEVVVTALRYPEPSTKIPAAGTIVPAETLAEKMAPNITEALSMMPGVSALGSGGFSLVPTIRGLARRRVLILIDNARIISDRRTGPNASFVNPGDIEKIEVIRSPSSIFYGSDAIGGVVHIFTKKPDFRSRFQGRIHAAYGTVNQEKDFGLCLSGNKGKLGFYLSFQGLDSENYSSPRGEVLQSQYSQGSLFSKVVYRSEERDIDISFLGARGVDIGKPNRNSQTAPTWYPHENQNLVQLHWQEKKVWDGDLSLHAYLNPNFLETKSEKIEGFKSKESYSKTQSTDFGLQISYGKKLNEQLRFISGVDYFGRLGVGAKNKDKYFDSLGNLTKTFEESPFTHGKRSDLGFYFSADYSGLKNLDVVGGIRWDWLKQQANPGDSAEPLKSSRGAWTGFLACSYGLTESLFVFANLSRAYRAPSLSERFYTGITGRGFIIAQPELKPETSLNFDIGLKLIAPRFFAGLYSFYYQINGMIERYLVEERTYTYGNIDKGQIKGIELEMEYYPISGWKIFGNFYAMKGVSIQTHTPLNDIPPFRVYAGTRFWVKKFSLEFNSTYQQKKDNPGPAEINIPGYESINIKASYLIGSSLDFYFILSNVFNKAFLARPDPEAMEEPGRNFIFGISYTF